MMERQVIVSTVTASSQQQKQQQQSLSAQQLQKIIKNISKEGEAEENVVDQKKKNEDEDEDEDYDSAAATRVNSNSSFYEHKRTKQSTIMDLIEKENSIINLGEAGPGNNNNNNNNSNSNTKHDTTTTTTTTTITTTTTNNNNFSISQKLKLNQNNNINNNYVASWTSLRRMRSSREDPNDLISPEEKLKQAWGQVSPLSLDISRGKNFQKITEEFISKASTMTSLRELGSFSCPSTLLVSMLFLS